MRSRTYDQLLRERELAALHTRYPFDPQYEPDHDEYDDNPSVDYNDRDYYDQEIDT